MKWDYSDDLIDFDIKGSGLFILCEGNFQYGNATLSFYDPAENYVQNEVFFRSNGMKLGDVAQSMTIYDQKGWIVVNNSHVIFCINLDTFRELGRIENLTSPRYIHFVSDEKAYVSQLWDNRIFIINPKTYSITGYIQVPGMSFESGSTEQMVEDGKYVYCTCWSYQNSVIKIDTETDEVVNKLELGIQPRSIVLDREHRLWILTDGGFDGSPFGFEPPSLYCVNLESFKVINEFYFKLGDSPSSLQLNGSGDTLYWLNEDVWRMSIYSEQLPSFPLLKDKKTKFYGLSINPENEEIYVADAIDYSQQGMVYRFSCSGDLLDEFYVGVTPGAFCWK